MNLGGFFFFLQERINTESIRYTRMTSFIIPMISLHSSSVFYIFQPCPQYISFFTTLLLLIRLIFSKLLLFLSEIIGKHDTIFNLSDVINILFFFKIISNDSFYNARVKVIAYISREKLIVTAAKMSLLLWVTSFQQFLEA